jgi:hypothetical protein
MGSLFIRDGYTERGFISGMDWEPGLRFRYRPMLPEEVADFQDALRRYKARAAEKFTAESVCPRLVDWDLVDVDRNPVDLCAANLLRIPQRYYQRVASIVLGYEAGDMDPTWSDDEKKPPQPADAHAKN